MPAARRRPDAKPAPRAPVRPAAPKASARAPAARTPAQTPARRPTSATPVSLERANAKPSATSTARAPTFVPARPAPRPQTPVGVVTDAKLAPVVGARRPTFIPAPVPLPATLVTEAPLAHAASGPQQIMYDTATSRHVSQAVLRALFLIGVAENDWNVDTCNSSDHCGVFQLARNWQSMHDYRDIAFWTNYAIDHGFYGFGGLNQIANGHPTWSIGEIVQACQGAGPTWQAAVTYYESRLGEADATLARYHGSVPAAPQLRQNYYNPLARASVRAERIDQGVDYAGTGEYIAIADANVSSVFPGGWGRFGNYVEYKITQPGPLNGVYVYYAEGIEPLVSYGQHISAGQPVCRLIPGWPYGTEIGFAAGDGRAHTYYYYHDGPYPEANSATRPGIAFSNLVRQLGGPAGLIEGPVIGKFPEYMQSGIPDGSIRAAPQATTGIGAGSGQNAPGAASSYTWPGAINSAFIQIQRGATQGTHHAHAAWFYARGKTFVTQAK